MSEHAVAWMGLLGSTLGLLFGVVALIGGYRSDSSLMHIAWLPIVIGLIGIPFGIANVLSSWS